MHGGVSQDIELRTVTFHPKPGYDTEETLLEMIGKLNVLNGQERPFTALLNDGVTTVTRNMAVGTFRQIGTNQVEIDFSATKPEWIAESATTDSASDTTSPFPLEMVNAGQAPVHPTFQIGWLTQRTSKETVTGQEWRKLLTLTNTQARTLAAFPYRIDLGNTAALVSGSKAQADGDDLRVIIDGQDTKRRLIGWNKVQSFCWVVIPGMDALEELTIEIVYGNASATNPPDWIDPDPEKPIIDISSTSGTATGGGTTSLIAVAGWATDQWYRGDLYMLTGANAGLFRNISANNGTTITCSAFPNPIVNTDTFLIVMSSNDRWVYSVRQQERESDYARGRWYIDSPNLTPNVPSFDSPSSWRPELILDNRDSMGQKRFSMLTTGGSDKDPFTILDAQRMWEGNDSNVYNPGTADGVAITTPVPIDSMYWEYQFDNPNGMVKAWTGVRSSGAEDWAEAYADTGATSGLTTIATQFINIQPDFGDVYQVAQALLPSNDIEIGLEWKRDTGSLTSATTTTSTDSSKVFETDQYVDGSILMLSGVNAGIKRTITDVAPTVITHAAFPTASADGDRYVVQNKRLKGLLRDGSKLSLNLDDSFITASYGSEEAVYEFAGALWVGNGPSGAASNQHRAFFGSYPAGDEDKRLFLAADEVIEIDAERRTVRIYDTVALEYTRTLTDPMVVVQWCPPLTDEWRRTADWLPFGVGSHQFWLEENAIGELELTVTYYAAYLGA